jgi:hypothetical protein
MAKRICGNQYRGIGSRLSATLRFRRTAPPLSGRRCADHHRPGSSRCRLGRAPFGCRSSTSVSSTSVPRPALVARASNQTTRDHLPERPHHDLQIEPAPTARRRGRARGRLPVPGPLPIRHGRLRPAPGRLPGRPGSPGAMLALRRQRQSRQRRTGGRHRLNPRGAHGGGLLEPAAPSPSPSAIPKSAVLASLQPGRGSASRREAASGGACASIPPRFTPPP